MVLYMQNQVKNELRKNRQYTVYVYTFAAGEERIRLLTQYRMYIDLLLEGNHFDRNDCLASWRRKLMATLQFCGNIS